MADVECQASGRAEEKNVNLQMPLQPNELRADVVLPVLENN